MNDLGTWVESVNIPRGTPELEIHDVEIQHRGGYSYRCTAKTSQGDMQVKVPTLADKPEDMDTKLWASRFSKQEIIAAAKVYTDIWTWHDDSEHYRMMMDLFVPYCEGKLRRVNPVAEGSIRYNRATDEMELMSAGNWIQVAGR